MSLLLKRPKNATENNAKYNLNILNQWKQIRRLNW